jgi:ferredoxin-NADP reductase
MSTYDVTLLGRREIAEGTLEHRFTWPEGFSFKAGQAVEVILPEPAGGHAFSLVNAPHQQELVVATRMRDSTYKRALRALPIGAPARVDGPFGSLTLHRNPSRAAVFIAGGIGITPFMSIVRNAVKEGLRHPLALVYSNRRARDAAYLDELQEIARSHGGLRLVTTMTEDGGGLVDAAMIRRAAEGLPTPIFYVAGPPAMVEAMKATLDKAGVEDTDVRSEEFFGYESAVPLAS